MENKFENELRDLINRYSKENDSNTPDFILAKFLSDCLVAFNRATTDRENWFGVKLDILNNWDELIMMAIGEASMCWSNIDGAGVFDSTRAESIGKKLLQQIKKGK